MILSFHTLSIRRKLMTLTMLTSGAVLLLVTVAFVANETLTHRRSMHQELTAVADIIGVNTAAAVIFGDPKAAGQTLEGLRSNSHILAAAILTPAGEVFAEYRAEGAQPGGELRPRPVSGTGQLRAGQETEKTGERGRWFGDFEVRTPMLLDNQIIGTVVLRSDSAELFARLQWFLVIVLLVTIGALFVAYALSAVLQRPIADPILELAETMKTVSAEKNYSIRAREQGSDEIGQLIRGFNEMLSQVQLRDAELERSTAELQESNAELKSFLYSAAHDLRQPLVNIRGFTGEIVSSLDEIRNILRTCGEHLPEQGRRRVDAVFEGEIKAASLFVSSSVERMAGLINALLRLSQLGHRELKPQHLPMAELVRCVVQNFAHQIREKNITVTVGTLPDVTADKTAVDQIMGNLLDNAVKYLEPGRTGEILISGVRVETGAIFHVRDNGRGIAAADVPKVFDLFRRVGTQDVPGEGVGLAYARALVRLHGGRIWCESQPGEGSTFSFVIPRHTTPSEEKNGRNPA